MIDESESAIDDNNLQKQNEKNEIIKEVALFDNIKENVQSQESLIVDHATKSSQHDLSGELIENELNHQEKVIKDTSNYLIINNNKKLVESSNLNQLKTSDGASIINYPILTKNFIPIKLQLYSNYKYPLDNTIVFTCWENALINAICLDFHNIDIIKDFILGSWFIDSSGQFIQLNYFNIDIFLSYKVLEETNLFIIDELNNTITLNCTIAAAINRHNTYFIFRRNKDLPFKLLVLHEANNLLTNNNSFTLEDLFISLNFKTYRTAVNTNETIIKEDLFRIKYIIDQSPYFTRQKNGSYSGSEIMFGSFVENELTSNKAINVMIKSAPIGHCFYRSELQILLEKEGVQYSEEDILLNERVFYFSGRFGVRPNFQFKKQSKISNTNSSNIDILNNIVIQTFSEISKPISAATLFSAIDGRKYFFEADSCSTKIIDNQIHSTIRSFIYLQPFIFCKNKKYFMIPKSCECDQFGHAYICLICHYLQKYGNTINEISIISKFNELRFPVKKNEATFIQMIKSAPAELMSFLEIPNLASDLAFDDDIIELFNNDSNDGEISKDSFSLGPIDEARELKQRINSYLTSLPIKSSAESSNDFIKRAKRKKILLDTIPDNQIIASNESNKVMAEDDFESDSIVSDLERKLIRLARKYYNPKILTYSTPKSFVDELIGQKAVNKEKKEFTINNDTESVELVTKELLNSSRFISNKEHEKFCYIGKIEKHQDSTSSTVNSSSTNTIAITIAPPLEDKEEEKESQIHSAAADNDDESSRDIFSNLNIFDDISENDEIDIKDKQKKISNTDSYSSSSSDVSDSYMGIDIELNKWDPPKTRKGQPKNMKPLSSVRSIKRNLTIEPNEFRPIIPAITDNLILLKERLKAMNKSKDHPGPTKYQMFSLYQEFGQGKTIEEFNSYIMEVEGMIFGENH